MDGINSSAAFVRQSYTVVERNTHTEWMDPTESRRQRRQFGLVRQAQLEGKLLAALALLV